MAKARRKKKRSSGRRSTKKRRSTTKSVSVKSARQWSHSVEPRWHPPAGLFSKGSAKHIASVLKRASRDRRAAMSRLTFYMNRAGINLSREQRTKLEHAKDILRA